MHDQQTSTNLLPKEILDFDIENTVRTMAEQVLTRYMASAQHDTLKINAIKEENAVIMKRFHELDFIIQKTQQRAGSVNDL